MAEQNQIPENENKIPKPPQVDNMIGGNSTPDPHPGHAKEVKPPKAISEALKDLTSKVTSDEKGDKPLPGTEEIKTFNAEHGAEESKSTLDYKAKAPRINWRIVSIFVALILVLIFAGFSFYKGDLYWVRDLFGFGLPSDPAKAIEQANNNTLEAEAYSSEYNIDFSGELMDQSISAGVSGTTEVNNETKSSKTTIKIGNLNLPQEYEETIGIDYSAIVESLNKQGDLEAVVVGNDSFLKMPFYSEEWYKIESSNFMDLSNFTILSAGEKTNRTFGLSAASSYAGLGNLQTEDLSSYLSNVTKAADTSVGGKRAYHYEAEIDFTKALSGSSEESLAGFEGDFLTSFLSNYLTSKMDVWIYKDSLRLAKVGYEISLDLDLADFESLGKIKADFSLQESYSNYDADINISSPADYQEFTQEEYEKLLSGEIADPKDQRNSQRVKDITQMQTALEQYFEDEGEYPKTKTDSKKDDFLKELVDGGYLNSAPKDPSHPDYYYYYESTDGKKYTLTGVKETKEGFEITDYSDTISSE